ncbi:MAG TPA: hypothetical protein VHK90_01580, partial [Thermoanaerobaculia bacterium]|nr:hypothetical protein [Thermoanaerobaculia bacterium]
ANGECLFAWRDAISSSTCPRILCTTVEFSIRGIRLGSQLDVLDATPLVLGADVEPFDLALAAADDGSYAIAAERNWTVGVRTLARDGTLSREVIREGRQPALARVANQWMLVREHAHRVIAMRFDANAAGSDLTLFRDAQARLQPDVAADGARALVTYERTTRDEPAGGVARVYVSTIEPPRGRVRAVAH